MRLRYADYRRPWLVWLAILAVVWQALLSLAHATAASDPDVRLVPVCSSTGLKWLEAGDDAPRGEGAERNHCPFCSGHAPLLGVGVTDGAWLSVSAPTTSAPDVTVSLRVGVFCAAPPPSRGPPLLS